MSFPLSRVNGSEKRMISLSIVGALACLRLQEIKALARRRRQQTPGHERNNKTQLSEGGQTSSGSRGMPVKTPLCLSLKTNQTPRQS